MSNKDEASMRQQQAALEQRINEMAQQSRLLESYMNDLMGREMTIARLLEEARSASTTIQGINSDSNMDSLMPVGIGVFVKTIVPPAKKLLVSVGSGVTIEKNKEDALNYVEARIKEYEVALREVGSQKQQVGMQMQQIQGLINQMMQGAQEEAHSHDHSGHDHTHDQSHPHSHSH